MTPLICPKTEENYKYFYAMLESEIDCPPTLNRGEKVDIEAIWRNIENLAEKWRGNKPLAIPGAPIDRRVDWGQTAEYELPPLLLTENFLEEDKKGGEKIAIDLGCGNSSLINPLLERGWRVIAVDYSKQVLDIVRNRHENAVITGKLVLIEENVADFLPSEPADLVIATGILPYIDPAKFRQTWIKIYDKFVKEEGFLIGNFFHLLGGREWQAEVNLLKEKGAWLLHDKFMVKSLLECTGYHLQEILYGEEVEEQSPLCIQFRAFKKKA